MKNAATAPAPHAHPYEITVRYGDTDQMRVAYHANYLYWFEIARTEWLRFRGKSYRELEAEGVSLPVTEAHCRYLASARYDDTLRLWAWVSALSRVTVQFDYRVDRTGDGKTLATGYTRHCFLDPDGRPVRIEGGLRALLDGDAQTATPRAS